MQIIKLDDLCDQLIKNAAFNLGIVAKTSYGKTILLKKILQETFHSFDMVLLITSNITLKKHYKNVILPTHIIVLQEKDNFLVILDGIQQICSDMLEKKDFEKLSVLLILDDLQKEVTRKVRLSMIRHYNIKTILLVQNITYIADRTNITHWLLEPSSIIDKISLDLIKNKNDLESIKMNITDLNRPFVYLDPNKDLSLFIQEEKKLQNFLISKKHFSVDIIFIKELINTILVKKNLLSENDL